MTAYPATYPATYGTAWPDGDSPIDLQTDLSIAGNWTGATSYVYQRGGDSPPVTISRGRPDEASQVNPSASAFEVNNRGGQFSPKNPLGPWYGQLGRNTPVRHSIPAAQNYLRLEEGATPRAFVNWVSALDITGSIEMRIALDLTDWQGCVLAAKWDNGGCWTWTLNSDGTLTFTWVDASVAQHSVTSTVPVPCTRGPFALRVQMHATNGNVSFWTSDTIDGTWTLLGDVNGATGGTATSILASSGSALVVGYSFALAGSLPVQLYGQVLEYRLYDGLTPGGTVVADAVFGDVPAGTAGWLDSYGRIWLLAGGAEVSDRDYRYHGEISALPPKWDVTGADQSVALTAAGPLRRLGQGKSPVQSPMRRAISSRSGTLKPPVYWPMEDGPGATAIGSAIGGTLMQFDGSPKLASDSSFPGSLPLPQLNGAPFFGRVPPYTSNGSIVFRWLCKPGSAGVNGADVVRLTTSGFPGTVSMRWYTGGALGMAGSIAVVGSIFDTGPLGYAADLPGNTIQQPLWMSLELRPGGIGFSYALVALPLNSSVGAGNILGSAAGTIGNVTGVYLDPGGVFGDWVFGHVSVQSDWESLFDPPIYRPFNAWAGELAATRYARLCGENGLACRIIGSPGQSAAMGQQGANTLQPLLQECEDADRGQAFEPRQVLGLGYRTYASLCQQPPRVTLDYSMATLGGTTGSDATGLDPTYDDQRVRNNETVTRGSSGGSGGQGAVYRYQLDDGSPLSVGVAGDYGDSQTVNVASDSQVPNVAGWLVRVGTVDEARWPAIPANLRRPAIQANGLYYPMLGLDVGDHLEVDSIPQVISYDPVRQLAFGLKESLGGFHHVMEVNGVPESPYEVILLDDDVFGRADTAGSQLAAPVSSGATTITVETTDGPVWTSDPDDLPFDIAVGGERMTVTAVSMVAKPGAGTRFGAWLDQTALGASDWSSAVTAWNALMTAAGQSVPLNAARWYKGGSAAGPGDFTLTTSMSQMISGGYRMLLTLKPAYSPVSSADKASMASLLATVKGMGADVIVTLWHEPFFDGISAADYVAMVQYYSSTVRQHFPLYSVFSGNDAIESNGYYPGDGFIDGIAADCYGVHKDDLVNCMAMADAHGLPLGLWETNVAFDLGVFPSPVTGVTQAQGQAFLAWIASLFQQRARYGRPNGDVMLFSGTGATTGTSSVLGPWSSQNGGFEGGRGNWIAGALSSVAQSGAQAHSGTGSLAVTCSGGGTSTVLSSSSANVPTQGLAITPGQSAIATGWWRAAATPRNTQVSLQWFNGSTGGATVNGTLVTDSTTGWTFVLVTGTAPASTTNARLIGSIAGASAGEVHYLDDPQLSLLPASTDHTAPVQYPFDWRIPSIAALQAALDLTSSPWQRFTVTRSVNGVVKAQSAGADVRLWHPPILALT